MTTTARAEASHFRFGARNAYAIRNSVRHTLQVRTAFRLTGDDHRRAAAPSAGDPVARLATGQAHPRAEPRAHRHDGHRVGRGGGPQRVVDRARPTTDAR